MENDDIPEDGKATITTIPLPIGTVSQVENANQDASNGAHEGEFVTGIDTHTCGACCISFTRLEDYIKHKLSTDNCSVRYKKQQRTLIPEIVPKAEKPPGVKSRRGRGRGVRARAPKHPPTDDAAPGDKHCCEVCGQSFGRLAALRCHVTREHPKGEDSGEESGGGGEEALEEEEEEEDPPYVQPTLQEPKEEAKETGSLVCSVCRRVFQDQGALSAHVVTHSSDKVFACGECPLTFRTKGSLKRHMLRHTDERPFGCHKCGMSFREAGALTRHWKARIPCTSKTSADFPRYGKRLPFNRLPPHRVVAIESALTSEVVPPETLGPSEVIASEAVTTEAILTEALTPEVASAEEPPSEMEVPGAEISGAVPMETIVECSQEEAKSDSALMDGSLVTYVVAQEVVGEELQPSREEKVEGSEVAGTSNLMCVLCEQPFEEIDLLHTHLVLHLGEEPLSCALCGLQPSTPSLLPDHLMSAHTAELTVLSQMEGIPLLARPVAEEDSASINQALQQLLRPPQAPPPALPPAPPQPRPHACEVCGKGFPTKDTLSKHRATHSNVRNYKCGECGKTFKRISHVREHLKVHSSERPYPCLLCHKAFKTANACKVHLRTHTNLQPFPCPRCPRAFREKSSLERHIRTHTGEKPFPCPRCGRRFAEHGTLNRHLRAKVLCQQSQTAVEIPDYMQRRLEAKEEPILENKAEQGEAVEEEHGAEPATSLLAEFSSVVTDTQHYIVPEESKVAAEYVTLVPEQNGEVIVLPPSEGQTEGQVVTSGAEAVQYVLLQDQVTLMLPEDADLQEPGQLTPAAECTVVAISEPIAAEEIHEETTAMQ